MARIEALTAETAPESARPSLAALRAAFGRAPNLFATFAQSGPALAGLLATSPPRPTPSRPARPSESSQAAGPIEVEQRSTGSGLRSMPRHGERSTRYAPMRDAAHPIAVNAALVHTPSRRVTGLERIWLVADALWPPFVNQLVVHGEGTPDVDAWRRAVAVLGGAWPAARARLRGVLGFTRWVADGVEPPLIVVDAASSWEAGALAAPETAIDRALSRPLDPRRGPIVEVVLTRDAVVLRTHHAAFDGRAAWAMAEDLAAILRGAPPRGAAFAGVDDALGGAAERAPPPDAPALIAWGEHRRWRRIDIPSGPRPLPRVLVALARSAGARVRLSVPVDLRRHLSEPRVAANLSGFVRLDVTPDARPDAVRAALEARLEEAKGALRAADGVRHVPLAVLGVLGAAAARGEARRGRGVVSASVSNLGRQDASVFDHGDFRGRGLFWIPPANPGSPVFVSLAGHAGGVSLCFAGAGADPLAVDRLASAVVAALP